MKHMKNWCSLTLSFLRTIWTKLGWRKAALLGIALLGILVLGFLLLDGMADSKARHHSPETSSPLAQSEESNTPASTSEADAATSGTPVSDTPQPSTPNTPKPKNQQQTPAPGTPSASLQFSASEVTVHAGWESSNFTASISNGKEFSGLSKEWNDNSPISIAHPLGTKTGKTVTFFVSVPLNTNPGTYTVKVRASDGNESYTANLKVRVLPPLVAFDSITYDDDLEGYIILLNIHENFTGNAVVQLTSSPNGTPCSGNQFFIDQIDEETYTFECLYGLSGATGNFPLTFSVSGAGKTWTKSVTWTR